MDPVNQQTLADQLGLSRATISRCFTNHRAINPETRARVFELAAQLGYRYLDLRTKPTGPKPLSTTLGVLICFSGDREEISETSIVHKLLDGVSELAQLRHVQLDVHLVDAADQSLEGASYRRVAALQRHLWAGVLLISCFPPRVVDGLLPLLPCVSLVEQYSRTDVNCVDVDHNRGIAQVIDLLVGLGHQRIGYYSAGSGPEDCRTMHRFSGYLERLIDAELEYRAEDTINANTRAVVPEEEALRALVRQTRAGVTAWVCATDAAAYPVVKELTAQGLRVPEDVSVTGFDGIKPPKELPVLTTLKIPYREIGMTGARRLLDLIQSPFNPPQHILLGSRLRRGATTGPAPVARRFGEGMRMLESVVSSERDGAASIEGEDRGSVERDGVASAE